MRLYFAYRHMYVTSSQLVLDPDEVLPKVESLGTRLHVLCSG